MLKKIIIILFLILISMTYIYSFHGIKIEQILKIREERKKLEIQNDMKRLELEKSKIELQNLKKKNLINE